MAARPLTLNLELVVFVSLVSTTNLSNAFAAGPKLSSCRGEMVISLVVVPFETVALSSSSPERAPASTVTGATFKAVMLSPGLRGISLVTLIKMSS